MVQGEKSSMLTATSCVARTSDPFARKAGFEAMQRADKGSSFGSSSSGSSPFAAMANKAQVASSSSSFSSAQTSSSKSGNVASGTSYGAWGPVFQNKSTFASMHFC